MNIQLFLCCLLESGMIERFIAYAISYLVSTIPYGFTVKSNLFTSQT
jgi:hypothetical protein